LRLPGISKDQMIEVDRILMEEYNVPVELMMEHAGLNLARLSTIKTEDANTLFQVIAGSGNNGGGGIVAARRLASWGREVEIYFPKGKRALYDTPRRQSIRAQKIGVPLFDGLPSRTKKDCLILDCYIGYGYKNRKDEISSTVFSFLQNSNKIISLDVPSGLDITSGENIGNFEPLATLTIAFIKKGLMTTKNQFIGELWITDIGVPSKVYQNKIGINWSGLFDSKDLMKLDEKFQQDSLHRVIIEKNLNKNQFFWWIKE